MTSSEFLVDNLDRCQWTATLYPAENESLSHHPTKDFLYPSEYGWTHIILASVIVSSIMLVIVLGNGLVIVAIMIDRNLTGLQNWFIASLAVSDLLVGLFIMPLSLANELMGYWMFGDVLCDLWLSTDVLLCTASILNLCLISLDRYWSITRAVTYIRQRTKRRAVLMISTVWFTSVIVCLPPLFGWKRPQPVATDGLKNDYPACILSEEPGYVIYSITCSFYLPLAIMVAVYVKIYSAAKVRARRSLAKTSQPYDDKRRVTEMKCMSFIRKGYKPESTALSGSSLPMASIHSGDERLSRRSVTDIDTDENVELENVYKTPRGKEPNEDLTTARRQDDDDEQPLESESKSFLIPAVTITCRDTDTPDFRPSTHLSPVHQLIRHSSLLDGNSSDDSRSPLMDRQRRDNPTRSEQVHLDLRSTGDRRDSLVSQADADEAKVRTFMAYETKRRKIKCMIGNDFNFAHALMAAKARGGRVHRTQWGGRHDMSNAVIDCERAKRKLARARERRATIVLGIVMASFIGCWLPFFSLYPIKLMTGMLVSPHVFSVIFWLGYCNSALNPIIYTIFNREFRQAFHRILRIRR